MLSFLSKPSARNKTSDVSFQDIFPAAEPGQDYFQRKDGAYCAVLSVTPVNMPLLEEEEAAHVVESLQEALNTAPERMMLLVSSERLNVDDYVAFLRQCIDKADNADQIDRLTSQIETIKSRSLRNEKVVKFYIVVQSQFQKLEPALSELADLDKQMNDILSKESLFTIRLEGHEILALWYGKLNPNTSLYEPFRRGMTLTDIMPSIADTSSSPFYYQLDETYFKSFTISSFPTSQREAGWLSPLFELPMDIDISITLVATDKEEILKKYNRSVRNLHFAKREAKSDRAEQKRIEQQEKDADYVLELLTNEQENLYRTTIVLTIRANSVEELRNHEKSLRTRISSKKMASRPLTRWAFEPLWYTLPLCYKGELEKLVQYNLPAESIASMQPFNSSTLSASDGIMLGENQQSHDLVILSMTLRRLYPHMMVLGETGSGKSYFLYYKALRHLDLGEYVLDMDPERERKTIPGNHIYFGLNHNNTINPFHIRSAVVDTDGTDEDGQKAGDYLRVKIGHLQTFFQWIYPAMSPIESAALQKAIIEAYKKHALTFESEVLPDTFPTLSEVAKLLGDMKDTEKMLLAFSPYFGEGTYARMFDGQTNWGFSEERSVLHGDAMENREVIFPYTRIDIRDLYDTKTPALVPLMDLLVHDIWEFCKAHPNITKNLLLDEQHILSDPRNPQSLDFVHQMVKRGRKYGVYMTGATQNVGDYLRTSVDLPEPPGQAIITNSGIKFLMRLNKNEVEKISEFVPLSQRERKILLGGNRPEQARGKGILIVGGQHAEMKTFMTPAELKAYNPNEYQRIYGE